MPFIRVEFAACEKIDPRTFRDGDVSDYQTWVVRWHIIMDGGWEDSVSIVEEVDNDYAEDSKCAELGYCADLINDQHISGRVEWGHINNSSGHLVSPKLY
jgi:hypothetical protein